MCVEAYRELVCEATFEPGVEAYLAMGTHAVVENHAKSLVSVQLL